MKIILVAAISLDGFITKHDSPGSGFTSREDKHYYNEVVQEFDSFIFGAANFALSRDWISRRLRSDQRKFVLTRDPRKHEQDAIPGEIEFLSSPAEAAQKLAADGRRKTALLGGGKIYGLFLKENLVDELWLTVEPVLFGDGVKLAEARLDFRGELLSCDNLNPSTLLLKYRALPGRTA